MTAARSPARSTSRDAATVTAWNLVSRLTGFGRVLVLGGALGATRLGDTYQGANQISNLLFEFLVAGTLSAVLVPGLVQRLVRSRSEAEEFALVLLGRALMLLAPVVVVGMLCARPIMRALLAGNEASTRAAQVRLGAFLLLFVLPQVLLYAWGAVVTAMLHAEHRFGAAAFAPIANNVVVSAGLGLFWARGASGVALGGADKLLLGATTLLGVGAMTIVPIAAARRCGIRVTPRWRGEVDRAAWIDAAWSSLVFIPAQVFLFASLVVAGRVAGGVVGCQVALTLFLLPHALLGHPLTTVLYPRIAAAWARADAGAARAAATMGLRWTLLATAVAGTGLFLLATPLARVIAVGALDRGDGPEVVAAALCGFAVGLPAYSATLLLTRVAYAAGNTRLPALAALAGGVVGLVGLSVAGEADLDTLRRIGYAHSAMATTAALLLYGALARRRVIAAGLA